MILQTAKPIIIQAGMGVGISDWRLARAVSRAGHLGVVSGTTIDSIMVRRLQSGDVGGHMRRALGHFPIIEAADKIISKYFIQGGLPNDAAYTSLPLLTAKLSSDQETLLIAASFAEVFLAKEGHTGKVGINFLEKIQMPLLPSLYGAMLAGVDYVLMGAGIPREVPGVLDLLSQGKDVEYKLHVANSESSDHYKISFSPSNFLSDAKELKRPDFLAIISSSALAVTLARKSTGKVNGFIIESPTAGGHNAPPRGKAPLSENGEPVYGLRDKVDLQSISELGLPYWLAGSQGSSQHLKEALNNGATGIQVGTAFALCNESGLEQGLKETLIKKALNNQVRVFTDPLASPTGFPFKVALMENTLSESINYTPRTRVCDLGYLREPFKRTDGTLGYKCPSEPVDTYIAKGGSRENTVGRKCLCNGLMANIGLGQRRKNGLVEQPLVTIGDDIIHIGQFIKSGSFSFSAQDVLDGIYGRD